MLKIFTITACSALLTVASGFLQAEENFVIDQQTELKTQKNNWDQKIVPQGLPIKQSRTATSRDSGIDGVNLYAKNVNFDIAGRIGFHIEELAATLEPKKIGAPVSFDDVESFAIRIHHGKVVVSPEVLTLLFNEHILDYPSRPLNNVTITTGHNYLRLVGGLRLWNRLPGKDWLPAKLGGTINLTEDNKLVYNIDEVKALGIPLAGLLKLVHIKLPWLLSLDREGAQLGSYEVELDHRSVFPPPALIGDISEVSLSTAGLHLTFADNPGVQFNKAPVTKDSYMWIQSGDPRLYGIVATNAQVAIVSESDTTPLRFNLYDYRKQVATGVIHVPGQEGTLIVTLPEDTLGPIPPAIEQICRNSLTFRTSCDDFVESPYANDKCRNSAGFNICDANNQVPANTALAQSKWDAQLAQLPMTTEPADTSIPIAPKEKCMNHAGFNLYCDEIVTASYADDKCKNSIGFNICE